VEQSCNAVTSVLDHAMTASEEAHMKCANTHAADLWSARTAVRRRAVHPAHLVSENAVDAALMENVPDSVLSHVIQQTTANNNMHVPNRVPGVVLITNVIIFVERSATALDVMPPAPKNLHAAIRVLACVERTVPRFVQLVMLKSFLLC